MKKTKNACRLKMFALLGVILTGGIVLAGCGQAPQDVKAPAEEVKTESPAVKVTPVAIPEKPPTVPEAPAPAPAVPAAAPPAAPEAPAPVPAVPAATQSPVTPEAAPAPVAPAAPVIPAKDRAEADFVKLYASQQESKKSGEQSKTAAKDFESKWKDVTALMIPKTLIKGLDLLAVDARATGPKECTFSFLLHTTADLDADYHLSVVGEVDSSHAQYIKPAKPGDSYVKWTLLLYNDPTSKWKAGEYHVVQLKVEGEIIPYDLSVVLQTRDAEKKWSGNPGNVVKLGWQADASDFAKLYALQQEYLKAGKKSKVVDQAFDSKWKALTADMAPKPLIAGLDVLAMDTRATGPKEYTFFLLLHTTAALDADYHLSVTGEVDPSHVQNIKPDKPGGSYIKWGLLLPNDPTSQWKAGEYHVVQLKVETEIIPYDISVVLQTRDAKNKWTGNPGNVVKLGWQADISE